MKNESVETSKCSLVPPKYFPGGHLCDFGAHKILSHLNTPHPNPNPNPNPHPNPNKVGPTPPPVYRPQAHFGPKGPTMGKGPIRGRISIWTRGANVNDCLGGAITGGGISSIEAYPKYGGISKIEVGIFLKKSTI